jgi:ADP-ribose pyrophosphatase
VAPVKKVEIQQKQMVFDRKFKIQQATLRFEKWNGQMSESVQRLVFERGDSAAVLVFNKDTGKVILIEQFRYPTYEKGPGWLREVIAGSIDEGEAPETCIRREVREEIGYAVHDLVPIATFYVSPGGSSERIFLYYTEVRNQDRVDAGGGLAGEHEDIRQVEVPLTDLWEALDQGEISDAKTLIAVQWLRRREGTQWTR